MTQKDKQKKAKKKPKKSQKKTALHYKVRFARTIKFTFTGLTAFWLLLSGKSITKEEL